MNISESGFKIGDRIVLRSELKLKNNLTGITEIKVVYRKGILKDFGEGLLHYLLIVDDEEIDIEIPIMTFENVKLDKQYYRDRKSVV